jgi:hypothetical protein
LVQEEVVWAGFGGVLVFVEDGAEGAGVGAEGAWVFWLIVLIIGSEVVGN